MEQKLTIGGIITQGIQIGLKNALSIIGALILWILTIWIPYLNVGTTIAIMTLPLSLSKGTVISPLEIFNSKYRAYMGEFFMITGLKTLVMFPAMLFMIIPAIVIGISWSLGTLLMIDKSIDPSSALTESNKLTNGHKWTIFLGLVVLVILIIVVFAILGFVTKFLGIIGTIITAVLALAIFPIILGANAHIYSSLTK